MGKGKGRKRVRGGREKGRQREREREGRLFTWSKSRPVRDLRLPVDKK